MDMRILVLFLFIYGLLFGQKDTVNFNFDNTLSGSLFNNGGVVQAGGRITTQNNIEYNKLNLNLSTNYQVSYQNGINGNEFLNRTNLNYGRIFCSHIFGYSLVREMVSDNSFGFGYSYKHKKKNTTYGISYAFIGQRTIFFDDSVVSVFRHSLRFKYRYDGKIIAFHTEAYLQPNIQTIKDQVIYGNIKLILLPKTKFSLVIQDNLNYYSLSEIKVIHVVTFGIGHTVISQKKFEKRRG